MDSTEVILVLSRLAHFAATTLVLGASMFRLYFWSAFRATRGIDQNFDRWLRTVFVVASTVALLSSITWLHAEAAAMGNGLSDALNSRTVAVVLFQTEFGHVWVWRLVAGALLLGALLSLRDHRWNTRAVALVGGVAVFLAASLAWTGHAVMRSGLVGLADMAAQTVHLLAASAWLGSLPALGYILYRARFDQLGAWGGLARKVVPRYSRVGYLAVGIISITGGLNSWPLVSRITQLVDTQYGGVLLAEIVLFALMVAVALVNRFAPSPIVIRPNSTLPGRTAALAVLGRNVVLEQFLGVLILGAVSVLGTLPPASIG
jgi:putative copper resistance protein D